MPILRVFSRKTNATPQDDYVAIGSPGLFIPDDISEIHISVAFTLDLEFAEILAEQWSRYGKVKMAARLRRCVARLSLPECTSRKATLSLLAVVIIIAGSAPFLSVRGLCASFLLLTAGICLMIICSLVQAVFEMLKRQKHRPEFTGGIEAKLLKAWHIELFKQVKPKQIFFAYDTPDDLPPLEHAAQLFKQAGYGNRNILRCYTLIGYPGDTFDKATQRLETVKNLGFCPMAMLYRDFKGEITRDWRRFQRSWTRPAAIYSPNWHDPLLP